MTETWDEAVATWLAASEDYRRRTDRALRGARCHYCGDPAQSFDHVIPRVQGGPDGPENLVPVCRSCNGAKSGLSLTDWAQKLEQEVRRADKRRRALQTVRGMLEARAFEQSAEPGADPEIDAIMDRVPWGKAA